MREREERRGRKGNAYPFRMECQRRKNRNEMRSFLPSPFIFRYPSFLLEGKVKKKEKKKWEFNSIQMEGY